MNLALNVLAGVMQVEWYPEELRETKGGGDLHFRAHHGGAPESGSDRR